MRFLSLLLILWLGSLGSAEEKTPLPYSTLFNRWNESVKQQIYSGVSIIHGDERLLAELRERAPNNLAFLREQVPNYFFAYQILDRVALGLPQRTTDAQETYVPIARYNATDTSPRSERAGGLLLFHGIRAVSNVPDSGDSFTLSVAASKASKARALIREAVQRGEFRISLLEEVKPAR